MSGAPRRRLLLFWLAASVTLLAIRAPTLDAPGLYYDEAYLAQQARDFLEPERTIVHPPGSSVVWIFGGPFPLWNAAYLGSLKSQLLIPALALFGSDPTVVRAATLATALVAMLVLSLWAQSLLGTPTAALALALVLVDPSFLYFGAYEWGPYTTLLLCRALGLWLLTAGWRAERGFAAGWRLASGGLAMGLGVYARADFGVVVACLAAALCAARGRVLVSEARRRAGLAALAVGAFAVGAAPMLASVVDVLETGASISSRGGLGYKASVLWSTLDGSNYHRVVRAGGLFDALFDEAAPGTLLPWAVLVALPLCAWLAFARGGTRGARDAAPDGAEASRRATLRFLVVAFALLAPAMWLVPGAVRAHHMLNLLPLPHLLVASALAAAFRTPRARIAAAAALALVLASDVRVARATDALIERTGGRGRFSDAIHALAERLDAEPGVTAVALDWGFHEPIAFLTRRAETREPIWTIARTLAAGRPWVRRGGANDVYLVHDAPYDLFQLGPKLLAAARALPPSRVAIERHDDREGGAAFFSVRFDSPHELVYTGEFSVRLY